ncbi:hypothetical protein M885DRAFT_530175 [Pelagophyceae sp. CCMP2097]|nr:hypothetical protein M885DRAFT_530175 [Pelagophyceae sp. CCMP2097]|mmetsp:Transcript_32368/g.109061  ORF Transcript_32368/g.109061 Transcript_32368/m.109061 type:complete len:204 (+) Transcript_32368:72-683(+)|eukprot:CAMPEP_0184111334 /NCGR_PEP_ID=MMETSP0974-20121125/17855_1 /TAXON_ID=483370 /ORGANISM="non described non described, Strain CCMP2097" /LENGTH=203 /DNA_ID=CAMNT_0026414411 /DNA_START=32 /DNA_END=643 /DNA_ORIENTATION=-
MSLVAAKILGFPKAFPFSFNLGVAATKTSAADLLTQVAVERKSFKDVDWNRNAAFAVFGFAYLGAFQYWLQVNMFRRWFAGADRFTQLSFAEKIRDVPGMMIAGKQVAFDVFIHLPFMYYPTFYLVKEAVQGGARSPDAVISGGLTKYATNFVPDQIAMFKIWAPADIIIFSVPMWLRLPCRHVVSFGWTAYISYLRGSEEKK